MSVWSADCSSVDKEVVFVVDSSQKPSEEQSWLDVLSFVEAIVNKLSVTMGAVRVAVVRYCDTAELSIALNHIDHHVHEQISNLSYDGEKRSDLARALAVTGTRAFAGARSGARRVVVVVTGHLLASSHLSSAVDDLTSADIELITVVVSGYGGVEVDMLRKISSESSMVDDYDKLNDKTDEVVQYICDDRHGIELQTPAERGKSSQITDH